MAFNICKNLCCCSSFAVTHDGEDQGDETVGNGDSLDEQEYRRRIELEAEERKLEETLEYQRRMENEAKLKHLAEQNKRTTKAVSGSMDAIMKSDIYKHCDNRQEINEQWKSSKKVNTPMLGFSYLCESFPFYSLFCKMKVIECCV